MPIRVLDEGDELAQEGVVLFHYPVSNCSQRARLALAEKGVEWSDRIVDLYRYENTEPWFQRLNPKGVVPVLVHGRNVVTESTEIVSYVDETFDGPALRSGDQLSRETGQAANDVQWCIKTLTYERVFRPQGHMTAAHLEEYRARQRNPDNIRFMEDFLAGFSPERIAECERQAHHLLMSAARLLEDRRAFLGGERPSTADLNLIASVERFYRLGLAGTAYPTVDDWRARMHARPSWARAVSAYE